MKYPQIVSMPSAVSEWLEEQLEARGIDAGVYARYILSLLHSDSVDVIYSDEDLHFSHLKKEVRPSGGSRKRVRRSSDRWRYAQADAEKLKRSAAVECLMSASEQTCGIESLIDELCEKLNEIKSDAHHVEPPATKSNPELQQVSPQELAKRYYAAFPPLNRNTSSASPSKLISLIPKWIPSPKKKPSNNRKQNRSYEDMMKANRTPGKQRYGAFCTGRNNNTSNKKEVGNQIGAACGSVFKKSRIEKVPKSEEAALDWNMQEDANMYDDLPVDIKELLDDSPTSHDVTVEMMNLANMRDTGRRGFIPCGTNITSSIWTNEAAMEEESVLFDNKYNSLLDLQFESIAISKNQPDLLSVELKSFFENSKAKVWNLQSWSDNGGGVEDDQIFNRFTVSLMKLNHTKKGSAFAEIVPKNHTQPFKPFSKVIGSGLHKDASLKTIDLEKEKDDLLTSVHSHFRPINEKVESYLQGKYADGATFVVSNSWDKINYQRTDSGAMYMENDYNKRKKYCEYKMKTSPNMEFVLKYLVCQNDKGCQTEDADAEVEAINADKQTKEKRTADEDETTAPQYDCTCQTLATNKDNSIGDCLIHPNGSECVVLTENIWQQQSCDKCSNGSVFWNPNADGLKNVKRELGWQFGTMSKIWSGGEVCHACLGRPPSTMQHCKLREDVSQDGDQLLSDLSSIQKSYMQESLPLTEVSCDIASFFDPAERKRRHSLSTTQIEESWSFASRLEEDCLIQMSTIPTLRSVTL